MATFVDANESTLSVFLSTSTYPTIASVKTARFERKTLDQSPFPGRYIQSKDLVLGGIIDDVGLFGADVIFELRVSCFCQRKP